MYQEPTFHTDHSVILDGPAGNICTTRECPYLFFVTLNSKSRSQRRSNHQKGDKNTHYWPYLWKYWIDFHENVHRRGDWRVLGNGTFKHRQFCKYVGQYRLFGTIHQKVIKILIIGHISGNTGPIFTKICPDVDNGEF